MADLDDVLKRLADDEEFTKQLADDPSAALAPYDLSVDDLSAIDAAGYNVSLGDQTSQKLELPGDDVAFKYDLGGKIDMATNKVDLGDEEFQQKAELTGEAHMDKVHMEYGTSSLKVEGMDGSDVGLKDALMDRSAAFKVEGLEGSDASYKVGMAEEIGADLKEAFAADDAGGDVAAMPEADLGGKIEDDAEVGDFSYEEAPPEVEEQPPAE